MTSQVNADKIDLIDTLNLETKEWLTKKYQAAVGFSKNWKKDRIIETIADYKYPDMENKAQPAEEHLELNLVLEQEKSGRLLTQLNAVVASDAQKSERILELTADCQEYSATMKTALLLLDRVSPDTSHGAMFVALEMARDELRKGLSAD